MQLIALDTSKGLIAVKAVQPSSQPGCANLILPDDRVLSAHGDDRDPGTDGPWEQGKVTGNVVAYHADGRYFAYPFIVIDGLP